MKIRPLSQDNRATAIRILANHSEWYGKLAYKKDISTVLACQMYEVIENGKFIAMFGINRFNYCKNIDNCQNVLCNVWVNKKNRHKGIFNKIVEFAIKTTRQDMIDEGHLIYLILCAEPKNMIARTIYNKKFQFLEYNVKQKLYWWAIE